MNKQCYFYGPESDSDALCTENVVWIIDNIPKYCNKTGTRNKHYSCQHHKNDMIEYTGDGDSFWNVTYIELYTVKYNK